MRLDGLIRPIVRLRIVGELQSGVAWRGNGGDSGKYGVPEDVISVKVGKLHRCNLQGQIDRVVMRACS